MPGKRTPSDPLDSSLNANDSDPKRTGIQRPMQGEVPGGQWDKGEAPHEGAYRTEAATEDPR